MTLHMELSALRLRAAHARSEHERERTVEFLRLVNASTGAADLIRAAITFFQQQSGCEAVGIRLKDGYDYPYFETRGFPKEFVLAENSLCAAGRRRQDRSGQRRRRDLRVQVRQRDLRAIQSGQTFLYGARQFLDEFHNQTARHP